MTRLLDSVIILVVIILISTLASSLKKEHFADQSIDIDTVSRSLGELGLNLFGANPGSPSKSFISMVPTLDDLLKSNFLRPEFTNGLAGANSISSRTCMNNSSTSKSLMSSMDSNKNDCNLLIDLQPYNFMATNIVLQVYLTDTNSKFLKIKPDANFVEFLLRRPVVFTVNNSKPYKINWGTNFLFTDLVIPSVDVYKNNMTETFMLPIDKAESVALNFFPVQALSVENIIANKINDNKAFQGKAGDLVELNVTAYYLKRDDTVPSKISLADESTSVSLNDNASLSKILTTYKFPKDPFKPENLLNPTFSVNFTLNVGVKQIPSNWPSLLSVADNGLSDCSVKGRSILLVEVRPEAQRKSAALSSYVESQQSNPNFTCLDFTNQEKDTGNNTIDACGINNKATIWVPNGVNVDISYIVSPSLKVVVAKYFKDGVPHVTFSHNFHKQPFILNDIITGIRALEKVYVVNQCKRNNYNKEDYRVSNINVSYGVNDLYEWFKS